MSSEESDNEDQLGGSGTSTRGTGFQLPSLRRKGNKNGKPRKKQFRWNYFKDLVLIEEVERLEPYNQIGSVANDRWQEVANIVGIGFNGSVTGIGAKDRFSRLLASHKKEDFKNRYKSGTEEEVTALSSRIADLATKLEDKKHEERELTAAKAKKVDDEKAAGEEIRTAAACNAGKRKGEVTDESPKSKRASEKGLVELWKDKQEQDRLLQDKRMELDIEQRNYDRELRREEISIAKEKLLQENMRLDLDRERLQLEKDKLFADSKLAQERFELEKLERINQMKTQEALIQLLSKK